jgi:hypothetical protein
MTNERRKNYSLRAGPDHAPFPAVKRLYCVDCGAIRDARRIGRAAEYTLNPCGHVRMPFSSELVTERNAEAANGSAQGH